MRREPWLLRVLIALRLAQVQNTVLGVIRLGWGVAWHRDERCETVLMRIPLNIAARWAWRLARWLKNPAWSPTLREQNDLLRGEVMRVRQMATDSYERGRKAGRRELKEELERGLADHRKRMEAEQN